jgi:hypothetical protein
MRWGSVAEAGTANTNDTAVSPITVVVTIAQSAILDRTRHLDAVIHSRMLLQSNGVTRRQPHHRGVREDATSTGRRPRWSLSDPTVSRAPTNPATYTAKITVGIIAVSPASANGCRAMSDIHAVGHHAFSAAFVRPEIPQMRTAKPRGELHLKGSRTDSGCVVTPKLEPLVRASPTRWYFDRPSPSGRRRVDRQQRCRTHQGQPARRLDENPMDGAWQHLGGQWPPSRWSFVVDASTMVGCTPRLCCSTGSTRSMSSRRSRCLPPAVKRSAVTGVRRR